MIFKNLLTNQVPLSRKTYYLLQLNYIDILFKVVSVITYIIIILKIYIYFLRGMFQNSLFYLIFLK